MISEISKAQAIPKKFLEQILLELKRHGIVASRRGRLGGRRGRAGVPPGPTGLGRKRRRLRPPPRFVDDAARAYSASSQQIRSLLQMQLEQLDPLQQKRFMDALQKLGS